MIFNFLIEKFLDKKTYVIISGLHGDEPAGNEAANFFKNQPNILIFSNLNPTKKRRYDGKDLNRHFDTNDKNDLQDKLLAKIEKLKPYMVISLHEDDEVDGLYAYCSSEIESVIKNALKKSNFKLANSAHNDNTNDGVITNGDQPYKGTLEKALKRRNILYCTIETPSKENFEKRVDCMKKIINIIVNENFQ